MRECRLWSISPCWVLNSSSSSSTSWPSHAIQRHIAILLRGHDHAPEGVAALEVRVRRGGLGERELAVDLDVQLAARNAVDQALDHRVDARVLAQDRAAQEDAAQRVVLRPQRLRLDLRARAP